MIVNDQMAVVLLGLIASGVAWCVKKLNRLSIDVAVIKQKLHMR